MNRQSIKKIISIQVLIVILLFLYGLYLHSGKTILLQIHTENVYNIFGDLQEVNRNEFDNPSEIYNGDRIYAVLEKVGENPYGEVWAPARYTKAKPEKGNIFLKGRVTYGGNFKDGENIETNKRDNIHITYKTLNWEYTRFNRNFIDKYGRPEVQNNRLCSNNPENKYISNGAFAKISTLNSGDSTLLELIIPKCN